MTSGRLMIGLIAATASALACSDLTEPASRASLTPKPLPTAAQPAPTAPPPPAPAPPSEAAQAETVAASHILVSYKGSMRADPSVTRSKEEAQKRAQEVLARAKKGEDFGKLADELSDDPSAKRNHGSLGKFTKAQMVPQFSDAAFALKPGGLSTLVETPFGFHVIKRTE